MTMSKDLPSEDEVEDMICDTLERHHYPASAKVVALRLYGQFGRNLSREVWLTQERLADKCAMPLATYKRIEQSLTDAGCMCVVEYLRPGDRWPTGGLVAKGGRILSANIVWFNEHLDRLGFREFPE